MVQQERAARTRGALIRSAARIFDRFGYAHTKLQDISSGAGVSPGALHFHFANKAAVAEAVEAEAGAILTRAAHIAHRESVSTLQSLADITHALLLILRWDVVARAGLLLGDDVSRQGGRVLAKEWYKGVERLLLEAADKGELAPGTKVPDMTCTIVTATSGIGLLTRDREEPRTEMALTGFWEVFLPALSTPANAGLLDPAGRPEVIGKAVAASPSMPRRILWAESAAQPGKLGSGV
ncbi:ScbR family autoregulator-binding transcription factor [Streptomyces sp. HPF1205]|uniref:ScbR family autoregulator-binding transcription factor n=1 Tax=Streptomyces sp. HPF1205 TaxID=2873262 RepID=UPI001CEC18D2|nr:ScbR family autoregulator-binding transcription factor [Streptomyces sp. HPF1205]